MNPLTHSTVSVSGDSFLPCYRRVRALAREADRSPREPSMTRKTGLGVTEIDVPEFIPRR